MSFFFFRDKYLTMELPDDVLQIVRAYAKPRFKYFREYNRALKVLRVYDGWDALKEKLQTDAEVVIPTLLSYQNAFIERTELEKELRDLILIKPMDSFKLDEIERMEHLIRQTKRIESTRFRFLSALLHPYPVFFYSPVFYHGTP